MQPKDGLQPSPWQGAWGRLHRASGRTSQQVCAALARTSRMLTQRSVTRFPPCPCQGEARWILLRQNLRSTFAELALTFRVHRQQDVTSKRLPCTDLGGHLQGQLHRDEVVGATCSQNRACESKFWGSQLLTEARNRGPPAPAAWYGATQEPQAWRGLCVLTCWPTSGLRSIAVEQRQLTHHCVACPDPSRR